MHNLFDDYKIIDTYFHAIYVFIATDYQTIGRYRNRHDKKMFFLVLTYS